MTGRDRRNARSRDLAAKSGLLAVLALLLLLFGATSAWGAGTLTVSKNIVQGGTVTGPGIDCGDDCEQFYSNVCEPNDNPPPPCIFVAQEVEITASASPGFAFQSWSDCDTPSDSSCTMVMGTSKTVTANYEDVEDPAVTLTSPLTGAQVRGSLNIAATAGDNVGVQRVEFLVRGAVVATDTSAPYATTVNTLGFADGSAAVTARAVDSGSNASSDGTTITIDNTAPPVSVTNGPAGATTETTPTFTYTASDATTGPPTVQCGFDGAFGPCSGAGSHTPSGPLAPGPHSFQVRATDGAGNQSTASRTFMVEGQPAPEPPGAGGTGGEGGGDAAAPDTEITAGPSPKTKARTARFEFSSTEPGSSFACRLDGGAFEPCASPKQYKVGKGKHTLEVRATDAAGNVDATPASRSWTVKKKKKKK